MPPGEQDLPRELQPNYSEDGVDLSLVRWMLSLTPAERLRVLEQHSANLEEILRRLRESGTDFVIVGELAGELNGAPVHTLELDIVHSRDTANVARLLPVLESLDAVFRIQPERRIQPNASYLSGPGHLNLITRFGPLDVLGSIGRGLAYADLLPHSAEMDIGGGIRVRVLDLETLIALKEDLGTDKDRAMLPLLRRTLEEQRRRERPVC